MLRNALAFSHVLSKDIIYNTGPQVSGQKLIFESLEDINNPDVGKIKMENGITTIVYKIPTANYLRELWSILKYVSNLEIEQINVTSLNLLSHQFYTLKSITIPDTITSIEDFCFQNYRITSIDLKNVRSIGNFAFANCSYLETIMAPSLTYISHRFAYNCYSLHTLKTGTLTRIGGLSFYQCYKLTSIDLSVVSSIGDSAFAYSGIESVTIPAICEEISDNAFEGCLSKITFDSKTTNLVIGKYVFYRSFIKSITLPSPLTLNGTYSFAFCHHLEEIHLPDEITSIPMYFAFECTSLKSVEAKGVTSVGSYAFQLCVNLESVKFGTATEFGNSSFQYCSKLKMDIDQTVPVIFNHYSFGFCESLSFNSVPSTWNLTGNGIFYGCNSLTSLKISAYINNANMMFKGCRGLKSVDLLEGVEVVPENCFRNCTSLTTFTFKDTLQSIKSYAFSHTALTGKYDFTSIEVFQYDI